MKQIRRQTARFSAVALIFVFYNMSRLPILPAAERAELASQFSFAATTLQEMPGFAQQAIRTVHPQLARVAGWLSAMGAAVALNDLDGDGLPNDLCHVDIRIDQVIVEPAPDTATRYAPFVLDHSSLRYDSSTMAPVGCLPNDMNEDGRMDLLVYYWGRTPVAFLNQGELPGTAQTLTAASYAPVEVADSEEVWWSSAATFADFDGDGHADLLVTNYFPDNTVLLGDAKGPLTWMEESLSRAFNGGGTHLFRWEDATQGGQPSVTFREIQGLFSDEIAHAWTLAVGAADLDGDLLPEIYFANDYGPDRLMHNRSTPGDLHFVPLNGEKFFTTPNSQVLGRDSFKGMGVDFGDMNDDGLLDIYVSNIAADYALHESHFAWINTGATERMKEGFAPFVDQGEDLGLSRTSWSWESRLADFNNDGVLEALQATGFKKGSVNRWAELQELGLGNDNLTHLPAAWPDFDLEADLNGNAPNAFFVRSASGRYFDLSADLGIAEAQVTRAIATADVDGDGDLDFAVANQWAASRFYRNDCPQCGNFLGLHLLLPIDQNSQAVIRSGQPGEDTLGRPAIGAFATVQLDVGRTLVGMVDGGNGQAGERSSDIHLGLGDHAANTPLTVDLRWRDASGQVQQQTVQLTPGWHTILLGSQ